MIQWMALMRIVMISETVGDAFGQERVVRDSTRLLRAAGHEVFYLAAKKNGEPEHDGIWLLPELFKIHTLYPWSKAVALHQRAFDYIESANPSLIHFIDQLDHRFMRALTRAYPTLLTAHTVAPTCPASGRLIHGDSICEEISGWKCLLHNKRYGCLKSFKSDLHRAHAIHNYVLKRRALDGVKSVIAISRYVEKTLIADGWPEDRVRLIYNPVAHPRDVRPIPDAPRNLIVCAARLVPMKGIDFLLRALARIPSIEWTLWICGDGPSKESLINLAYELQIGKRVQFLGATPYEKTQSIMASARLVAQSNLGPEGFGLTVAEASALGVPVVGYDVPALNEIVVNGETGFLAKPRDVEGLAGYLKIVLTNPALARDFGEAGRKRVRSLFSPERHLSETLATYEHCVQLAGLEEAV
jgi:glycosyltransferase involved in cell wall biosynthesis